MKVFEASNCARFAAALLTALVAACGGGGGDTPATAVSINATPPPTAVILSGLRSITLDPVPGPVHWGRTVQMKAVAINTAGTVASDAIYTWTSSDTNVANVDVNGLLTLLNPGTASIQATAGGVTSNAIAVGAKGFAADSLAVREKDNCVVDDNRTEVICWGDGYAIHPNQPLQLEYPSPTVLGLGQIPAGTRIAQVAPGFKHNCVLTEAGAPYCWAGSASNAEQIRGMGTLVAANQPAPVQRGELPDGVITKKIVNGFSGTCSIGSDGKLYCWGWTGSITRPVVLRPLSELYYSTPTEVSVSAAGVRFVDFGFGGNVNCALADTGGIYCGRSGNNNSSTPLQLITPTVNQVPANVKLIQLKASNSGRDFWGALGNDGWVYLYGDGFGRSFGNGSSTFVNARQLTRLGQGDIPAGVKLTAFSIGGLSGSSCVLGDNGKAYCWGAGYQGSAGDGDLREHDVLSPKQVLQGQVPATVKLVSIECGTFHCTAIGSDRKTYAWGFGEGAATGGAGTVAVPTLINRVKG